MFLNYILEKENPFIIIASMRRILTGISCAFLVLIIWISGAEASPFHQHKHETKSSSIGSHKDHHVCPMKHHQKGLPCPHTQSKKNKHKEFHISSDCNGLPVGSIPTSTDLSKNLFSVLSNSSLTITGKKEKVVRLVPIYKYSFSFQLDPPPKFL